MAASDKVVWAQPTNNALGDAGVVIGALKEGSHKFAVELIEKIMSGKKYFKQSTVEEEIGLTFDKIEGDAGQEQLINAIRKGIELKLWIINKKLEADGTHKALFAYTMIEELENGFDDEEDTIEITVKVQIETVPMSFPKLPDSVLNPSAAVTVEAELPGDATGNLDNRTVAPAESGAGA